MLQLIASIVPHYIIGMALGAGVYGMFMLCEGFFVNRANIPDWWIWGYYIGFHTYSFEIFMYNEFGSDPPGVTVGQDVLKVGLFSCL
jgi:ABC-type multidrug transport system permease subunit